VADSADLLLHPVRLRIVQAFLRGRPLTTAQLSSELSDIPPASLYRHVARLVRVGVLEAVSERKVRGALERTYTLRLPAAVAQPDKPATMTAEDQRQAFVALTAGLLGDLDRYLAGGDADLFRDGVGYSMAGLWLDDAELADLLGDLARLLQSRMANARRAGRRRRVFAYALLAADKTA
jgi:DNA-binding transcriptional ArsR family regulator